MHNPTFAYIHVTAKSSNILNALIEVFKTHFCISTIIIQEYCEALLEIRRISEINGRIKNFVSIEAFEKSNLQNLYLYKYVSVQELIEVTEVKKVTAKENSWL